MDEATIGGVVIMRDARFEGGEVRLLDSDGNWQGRCNAAALSICYGNLQSIDLQHSTFTGALAAQDTTVKAHIALDSVTTSADVNLRATRVGGHIALSKATQLNLVDLRYARVEQSVYGDRIRRWDGDLDLAQAAIGREVFFTGVEHWAGGMYMAYSTVGSRIYLDNINFLSPNNCSSDGLRCRNINLAYAKVDGPFELVHSTVHERIWAPNAAFKGEVNLAGSLLHSTANFMQLSFTNLRGVPDECRFAVPPLRPADQGPGPNHNAGTNDRKLALMVAGPGVEGGRLQLSGARFDYAVLDADVVRAFDPATARRVTKGDAFAPIEIAGAVYGLRGPAPCNAATPGSEATGASGNSASDFFNGDIALVARWLSSEQVNPSAGDRPFKGMKVINAQPYEVLARNLNEAGRRQDADDVLQAKFDRRVEAEAPSWKALENASSEKLKYLGHTAWWCFMWLAGWLINYGLSNERAFLWWFLLVGVGMFVRLGLRDMVWNSVANLLAPRRRRPTVPRFLLMCRPRTARLFRHECNSWFTQVYHAFLYSVAMAVPIVSDLFKPHARFAYSAPNNGRYLGPVEAPTYFMFHKLLAFVLVTLTVAGVAGLIK